MVSRKGEVIGLHTLDRMTQETEKLLMQAEGHVAWSGQEGAGRETVRCRQEVGGSLKGRGRPVS